MDEPWVKHNRVNVVLQDLTPLFVFAGLVQQTVQIVASHDLTLFVGRQPWVQTYQ